MPGKHWTPAEDKRLLLDWGHKNVRTIAKALGRPPSGVDERAYKLGLPCPRMASRLVSRQQIADTTGYDRHRVDGAIERLGLKPRPVPRGGDPRRRKARHRRGFDADQVEAICALLASVPDGQRLYRLTGQRTERGVWGVGRKPPACLDCGKTSAPHYGRGRCHKCWWQARKSGACAVVVAA